MAYPQIYDHIPRTTPQMKWQASDQNHLLTIVRQRGCPCRKSWSQISVYLTREHEVNRLWRRYVRNRINTPILSSTTSPGVPRHREIPRYIWWRNILKSDNLSPCNFSLDQVAANLSEYWTEKDDSVNVTCLFFGLRRQGRVIMDEWMN